MPKHIIVHTSNLFPIESLRNCVGIKTRNWSLKTTIPYSNKLHIHNFKHVLPEGLSCGTKSNFALNA